ncbi:hypothetical protein LJ739_07870 [Aestuariibacter halophilus]|uniref:Uncharacterized protein n=1 Tax=Fluctibacter halophilus TaxID=226011 RepID=A0ABS8G6K2_9ALTE|nr:hypothetical protein [Aestuariibacter halophilus]MCC2616153.1 hypothetical protein [Aestuariibacter halophilus]
MNPVALVAVYVLLSEGLFALFPNAMGGGYSPIDIVAIAGIVVLAVTVCWASVAHRCCLDLTRIKTSDDKHDDHPVAG